MHFTINLNFNNFGTLSSFYVGVYVRESLRVVPVEVDLPNLVIVFVVQWSLYVVAMYRPPSYSSEDNARLLSFLSMFCSPEKEVLLLGDFNLPSIKWNTPDPGAEYLSPLDRSFYEMFLLSGLTQFVLEGTFFPSGNILDLVFSSDSESVVDCSVLAPFPPMPS